MEFACPACSAPHAFPDEAVPADGITVACTRCAVHIHLRPSGPTLVSAPKSTAEAPIASHTAVTPAKSPPAEPPAPAPPGPPPPAPPEAPSPPEVTIEPVDEAEDDLLDKATDAAKAVAGAAKSVADAGAKAFESVASEPIEAEHDVPEGLAFPGFSPSGGQWSWRDLPRAFVSVFDRRRVLFTTAGLWAVLTAFAVLQWLGGWLGAKLSVLGVVFDVLAWGALVGGTSLVMAVMTFVLQQTIIEQRPSSVKAGVSWVREWKRSLALTPTAFVAVIAAAAVGIWGLGLIGRIPGVGPIIWGATSPVSFALGLLAGAAFLGLLYCLPLYVPIVYTEKTGWKDTLRRLVELYRSQGFRLMGHVLLALIMIGLAASISLLPLWSVAGTVTGLASISGMGPDLAGTIAGAPSGFLPFIVLALGPVGALAGASGFAGGMLGVSVAFKHSLGGLLLGIGATGAVAFGLALVLLSYYTAGCIIYASVTGQRKS